MSSCNPNKVRQMVTYLGTHLFITDNSDVFTMLLICDGNHNRLGLKCSNCYKLMINHRLSVFCRGRDFGTFSLKKIKCRIQNNLGAPFGASKFAWG